MKNRIDAIFKSQFEEYKKELIARDIKPALTIVTVGDDPASKVYVANKIKLLKEVGVDCHHIVKCALSTTQEDLDSLAKENETPLLFQLPMPNGLVAPDLPSNMDVDAFGLEAMSLVMQGNAKILPCTVQAVLDIIGTYPKSVAGLNVAVIGRSNIVGKPLSVELINRQATVTTFNSKSMLSQVDWKVFDIVVVATGVHGVVKASMFREGQMVIDVGINRVDGKLVGDVKHDSVNEKVCITPVPGGVGRLTVMNVLGNLLKITS